MLVSHEVPKALLSKSRDWNDYDYALLHLKPNKEYWDFYKESVGLGRKVLLDNSAFELGAGMSNEKLAEGIEDLHPTWYVVPDTLNDLHKTVSSWESWEKDFGGKYKGAIGCIQGSNYEEVIECYKYFSDKADKIAIPVAAVNYADNMFEGIDSATKILERRWLGRTFLIRDLMNRGIWNFDKPHHLLGCTQAIEFRDPIYQYRCFDTLDTSNPIVAGLEGEPYNQFGLQNKSKTKLADLIEAKPTDEQLALIEGNVQIFKHIIGR